MAHEEKAKSRLLSFLLVEDDEDHAQLLIRSLENNRIINHIDHVKDGVEAMEFLMANGKYANRIRPDVILLDLKLPKLDGHQVLKKIKNDPNLRSIPVVILTTSAAESDRFAAYEQHANSYLVKPLDFNCFKKMAEDLKLYWGVWNQSPSDDKDLK